MRAGSASARSVTPICALSWIETETAMKVSQTGRMAASSSAKRIGRPAP